MEHHSSLGTQIGESANEMTDFFVILPCNVKDEKFLNTIATYTTQLPKRFNLVGNWYVGLSEISYTKSWRNLRDTPTLGLRSANYSRFFVFDYGFKAQVFTTPHALVDKLNYVYEVMWDVEKEHSQDVDAMKPIKFSFTPSNEYVQIEAGILVVNGKKELVYPDLGYELSNILGFDVPIKPREKSATIQGIRSPDLSGHIRSLYVYSDIVSPSIVGDEHANILRIVPVANSRFGTDIDTVFTNPYYYKVNNREFSKITIYIKDDVGKTVPFEYGRLVVTLHFKKWINIT